MARPLVFTANGREPPGRHLSSTRFQNAVSTGVEAALASLFSFTSEQPDGDRSHCGAPGSRTTALVCPRALSAAEFARNSFAIPEGIALSPETHGLSEDLAVVTSPRAASSTQPELGGVEITSISWRKRVSPWWNKFHRAKPKFAQPEVRPAPERPHRSSQTVDCRDNRQHHCAGALVAG